MKKRLIFILFISSFISGYTQVSKLDRLDNYINELEKRNFYGDVITTDGTDNNGDTVEFQIYVLSQVEEWKSGSADFLESGLQVNNVLPTFLKILPLFGKSENIICVGTASISGDLQFNYDLAKKRAIRIRDNINTLDVSEKKIYLLNLGRYNPQNNMGDASWQRKIIVIGTINEKKKTNNLNSIRQALLNALNKPNSGLYINITDYNVFELRE